MPLHRGHRNSGVRKGTPWTVSGRSGDADGQDGASCTDFHPIALFQAFPVLWISEVLGAFNF